MLSEFNIREQFFGFPGDAWLLRVHQMGYLPHVNLRKSSCCSMVLALLVSSNLAGAELNPDELVYPTREALSRGEYLQRVLQNNHVIQARLASFGSALNLHRAESGLMEPELVGTGQWIDRQRPNTIELERSLQSGGVFIERNLVYSGGVEVRTPTGARVRVGASARRLRNNVQRTVIVDLDAEYETSLDLSIEQPLLRGAGPGVALAPRRMAARSAEIGYQEFRWQLMQTVAQAEITYWELALAQEQYRLSNESVGSARALLDDSQARLDAGRGARIDVIEAQAGLAQRETRRARARQRLIEAMNRLAAFFNGRPQQDGVQYEATETPHIDSLRFSYAEGTDAALTMSPDVLRTQRVVAQELLRVQLARNERLPQVDLRATFGSAGLGFDWNSALDDTEHVRFPQWVVGVDVRIPILAGVRSRNELAAARQRLRQAEYNLADMEATIRTEMDAAIRRVESAEGIVSGHRSAVSYRQALLDDRMTGREAGRVDARTVLEAEDDLVASQLEMRDSEVEYERALLELQLLQGNLLQHRGLELTMDDLQTKARGWLRGDQPVIDFLDYREPSFRNLPAAGPLMNVDGRVEPEGRRFPLWFGRDGGEDE